MYHILSMATKNQKATFVLPIQLVRRMHRAVEEGMVVSASQLVRDAIDGHLLELERERRHSEMRAASGDPLFLADLQETMQAFESADAESARLIPE